jgi:hypothetical protein
MVNFILKKGEIFAKCKGCTYDLWDNGPLSWEILSIRYQYYFVFRDMPHKQRIREWVGVFWGCRGVQ